MQNKLSVREAINYLWSSPNKWGRIVTWIAAAIAIEGVSIGLQVLANVPIIGIILFCVIYPFWLVFSFLAAFYIYGYTLEVMKIGRAGSKELPEVFKDMKSRLGEGGKLYLIYLVYSLPLVFVYTILILLAIVPFILFNESTSEPNTIAILLMILLGVVMVLALIVATMAVVFAYQASIYRYISDNNLGQAFQFGKVFQVLKRGIKEQLIYTLKGFGLSIILTVVIVLLFTPAFLLLVFGVGSFDENVRIIMTVLAIVAGLIALVPTMIIAVSCQYYVFPHLYGQMFRVWDQKGLNKI